MFGLVAYYDIPSVSDNLYDKGKYTGDIHQLLFTINDFYEEFNLLKFRGKLVSVVSNTNTPYWMIHLHRIKSIYLFEPTLRNDCYTVYIETYPYAEAPVEGAKGVRKTWLEGYSVAKEFYHPDYSVLPPQPDYRRTLYWNPSVTTDEDGAARIRFYNNSGCKSFSISAETVTAEGMIGVYVND